MEVMMWGVVDDVIGSEGVIGGPGVHHRRVRRPRWSQYGVCYRREGGR